jgi:protein ImuB
LPTPKPIEVELSEPNASPIEIVYQGMRSSIVHAIGPERIDSGWWHGSTQQRDYYRIELSNRSWLWIYRDRRGKRWYLHGEFD